MRFAIRYACSLLSFIFLVVPSMALPNIGALMKRGPDGEPSHFERRLLSADPISLHTMITSLRDTVSELNNRTSVPEADDLMRTPVRQVTSDQIYRAFNIQPSDAMADYYRRRSLMPLGEDSSHAYQPPAQGARRGPCPGLNTIANHGYLPRNGIVNPIQLVVGTFEGLNLSPDLAGILAAISFIGMGDLLQMQLSIGAKSGLGDGLNHHGILEGDGSVTRLDHYFGNSWDANPALVEMFINETNTWGHGDVTPYSLAHSRYRAWDYGRKSNPVFDFNPWRMLVAYAESGFVHQLLRGSLSRFDEIAIRSWFVQERFPEGWSKRLVPFSTPEILAWAGLIAGLKPIIPGTGDGHGGFVPTPNTDPAYSKMAGMMGNKYANTTVGDLLCYAGNEVLGFIPSQLINIVGALGLKGVSTEIKCK
ncbi:Chloroperoxidase [Kalmanozyma brasiliensis GHG001]|uniref:Heme haloperoxidase family profile domain-containing protein n=1 Tax=Kalmanozyma brasiliensis (strain GHG001) TaxID=1365824 RepID=V5EA37_KALBG|nr:Chloroperoxidase [Kalmanozyma brasiliensis GHG001]EST07231.1 Chloroperoxidase [Kalmanozyma brasiliensis GHG001]